MHIIRLKLADNCDEHIANILGEALIDTALSSAAHKENRNHNGPWVLEWLMQDKPDLSDVLSRLALQIAAHDLGEELNDYITDSGRIRINEIIEENWLEKTYRDFPPFSIGPFFIHGDHYKDAPPKGQIPLTIDAATAFGSGEHGTTHGCLEAMLDLKGKGICPWNILDMGTGSGILAIAAWKLWKSPILAVDNDEESVIVTTRHAEMNGVRLSKSTITCIHGDGFNTKLVTKNKPYELIIANILAGPVIEMAPAVINVLDENGYVVLSGMLIQQADLVASAYEGLGLTLKKKYDFGEWSTLTMHKGLR